MGSFLMGLFNRKPKVVKEIYGGAWGHLVQAHGLTVEELGNDFRCVDKPGTSQDGIKVTFLRVFSLSGAQKKGVTVAGWETFDEHPDLIAFEGHLDDYNQAYLERRNGRLG